MLRGDEIWSQGMSEPDAGSDLASLRTSAVLDDDHFVVNGQKTWNSHGDLADWCQLYVRSDPSQTKHRGLSCLLVEMGAPGIDVRPIRTITGEAPFAEIWLHDVRVPATALLGPLHAGWSVAMATLGHERAGVAGLHVQLAATFERLVADVQAAGIGSRPVVRQRLAELLASISCMRWTTERLLEETAGTAPAPTTGSLAKLSWAAIEQAMASTAVDLLGVRALGGPWAVNLSRARQASIAGGTTEINRTIVGEQALGLPRPR
jgi:alkylation response protein AidB-like acyl-CoA dehydrogenase